MQRTRLSRLSIQNLVGRLALDQVQQSPHVMTIVQRRQPRSFMLGFEHDPLLFTGFELRFDAPYRNSTSMI